MLQNLPPELVEQIAGSVGDAAILHLRLTCQQLYEKTSSAFAAAFFSCVAVDLCPKPLEKLRQIADNEKLRPYVRKLVIAGELPNGCPNPPRHLPGTGHCWPRDPSSGCLNPSSPAISDLHEIVSKLVNCCSVAVRDDNEPNAELREPGETGLLLMDTVHVALLIATGLQTIRSFQIVHEAARMHGYTRSLLPRSVTASLSESWARNLVDLHLQWYSRHDHDSLFVLVDLALGAKSLRKLCMRGAPAKFYRRLAAAPPNDLPLTVLDLREAHITPDLLVSLAARFRHTLEHLYVYHIRLNAAENWPAVLRDWARNLGQLKSFGLQTLLGCRAPRKPLLFSPILEWEGMPTSGWVQFTTKLFSLARREVDGVRYENRSRAEDVQSVLRKLAEYCSLVPGSDATAVGLESNGEGDEYRIAGGLVAQRVFLFHSPDTNF